VTLPRVSVIILALNEAENIVHCIRSIRDQGYPDVEIVVSDGGSTDGTVELAERLADRVVSGPDPTLGAARNKGARVASGEVFVFLPADTRLLPHALDRIAHSLEASCIVGGSSLFYSSEARYVDRIAISLMNSIWWFAYKVGHPVFCGECIFVRRSAFKKIGGFNEQLDQAEDVDFGLRLRKLGRVVILRKLFDTSLRRVRKWGWWKLWRRWLSSYILVRRGRLPPRYTRITT